ncbi:hypothetical protein PRIPAC_87012 [Pristionchus pacificus]|uniref:RNA-directed DNA polymerase n=1 Tax=Pristionchus pacificus TaxID=54126 RepID=A0A2A6CCI6_PRIPA|nr:hypothetical protein PRIPAC_87012 [Pristionchus pacificus]|eukprot:PDM75753.1 hypothetical protein PRIPAC_40132 [Pristionchus pacificus]
MTGIGISVRVDGCGRQQHFVGDMDEHNLLYGEDGKLIEEEENEEMMNEEELLREAPAVEEEGLIHPVEKEAIKGLIEGAKHGIEVRERFTRSKTRKIENSKEPRDAIKRIRMKCDTARQNLKAREESKGSTAEAILEFEGIFDKERKLIEDDLLLLDGVLVANSTDQSNVEKWKSRFQECKEKLIAMSDEIEKAKNGSVEADETSTVFDTLAELRSNYEALLEEKKNRETRDNTILATVGVESMEEVIDRATKGERRNFAAETSTKVLEQITSALDEVGHSNIAMLVDEIFKLREVNDKQADVLDEIMESLNVIDMKDIMVSIQLSQKDVREKMKKLEIDLAKAEDLVERRTRERNEAIAEHEQAKQALFEKERAADAALTKQREARAAMSAAFRGFNLNDARKQRKERDTDKLRLGNVGAQIVLKEMLSGRALTEYASIPDEYRSKPVRDCLEWLKEKCFGNSMFVEMDLEKKWRAMTVGGRKVDTVCNDIEYIVSKLHTDEHKQEDAKRVQFLLMYENNREYPELLKMMDEKKSYAEMKEHMRRAEYIERSLNQSRLESRGTSNSGRVISGKRYQLNNGANGRVDSRTCFNCQGIGHLGRECPSKKDLSGRFVNARCSGCGGEGHTSRMCYPDPAAKRLPNRAPEMHNGTLRDAQVSPHKRGSQVNDVSNANHTPVIQSATGVGSGLGGSGRVNDNGQRRYGNGSRFNSGNNSNSRVQMITMNEANKGGRENRVSFNRRKPAYVRSENVTRKESENGVEETPLMVQASRTGDVINEDPLFVKRFRPVQGVIGGLQVEACLDTGAEVNLIDKRRVDSMNGVVVEENINFDICEALGKSVKTIGTVVVDVEMNVGRKCRVGFVVSESDIPTVLLGNGALEAMGLELNMKKEVLEAGDAVVSSQPDSAIVLKDVRIGPGRIGSVFVGGGRPGEGSKVLITDRVEVVEGTNDGSRDVQVPVWNSTDRDLVFKRDDTIGVWCKVEDIDGVKKDEASEIKAIVKHLRRQQDEERKRDNQIDAEEKENLKQWKLDQNKDEWVTKMLSKLDEVAKNKRDIEEEVVVPGTTKRTSLADWVVHNGLLYLLGQDHEKKLYIPEGRRKQFVKEIHDSPLSGHLCTKKMVQKLSQEAFWGSMNKDVEEVLRKYVTDYKRRLSWMMEKTRSIVALKLESERKKMKELYDAKNQHNMKIKPEKGDRVYVKVEAKQGDMRKMMTNFEGPYRVIRTSNTTVTVVRADNGLENGRENDERTVQWDRVRLVPRDINDGNNVKKVNRIAMKRDSNRDDFRVSVYEGTKLHPDFECNEDGCGGGRKLEEFFPRERLGIGRVGKVVVKTLRQLAALIDLKDEWPDLSIQRANTEMKERVDLKQISSRAMKKAYEEGICEHRIEASNSVDRVGVLIEGEELAVSEAVSSALVRKGGRSSRKPLLVMVPQDSVVAKCEGRMDEVEMTCYQDLQDLRKQMGGMESSGNFPKSLFILIKHTFARESIEELKAYLGEVTTDAEVTVYVAADLLPSKKNEVKQEIVKTHQELLTLWSTEDIPVNYQLRLGHALWRPPKAVKYIVDGKAFPIEDIGCGGGESMKRPAPSEWAGNASSSKKSFPKKPRSDFCYNCRKAGHYASTCRNPKKDDSDG